jgi:hypothetical protein
VECEREEVLLVGRQAVRTRLEERESRLNPRLQQANMEVPDDGEVNKIKVMKQLNTAYGYMAIVLCKWRHCDGIDSANKAKPNVMVRM